MKRRPIQRRILAILIVLTLCVPYLPRLDVQAAKSTKDILNETSLKPVRTNYEPLDKLVSKVLDEVVLEDMTTYEKVKACYDYLIRTTSYSNNIFNDLVYQEIMKSSYSSEWDKKVIYYAYSALKNKKDSCYGYSSAFVVLTRAIGLESYVMQGKTAMAKGGYGNHWWVNIKIDGKYYIFDPNVEDDIAKGSTIYYYRFCKLDSQVPGKYIYANREKDVDQFNEFRFDIALKSIGLSQTKKTLYVGDTYTLTLKYKPKDAIITDKVKWKSSNKKVVSVSKNGKITAKKTGTAYISATVGNKSVKCKVSVKKPFIKLNQSSVTLKAKGKQYKLKAKVSSNLKKKELKWKTSNKKVVTVTKDGKLKAIGKGSATITARIGKVKTKCKITVE